MQRCLLLPNQQDGSIFPCFLKPSTSCSKKNCNLPFSVNKSSYQNISAWIILNVSFHQSDICSPTQNSAWLTVAFIWFKGFVLLTLTIVSECLLCASLTTTKLHRVSWCMHGLFSWVYNWMLLSWRCWQRLEIKISISLAVTAMPEEVLQLPYRWFMFRFYAAESLW